MHPSRSRPVSPSKTDKNKTDIKMGRHDSTLRLAGQRMSLATGFYASTQVQTAFGWQAASALGPGDLVMTRDLGLMPIAAVRTEHRQALWSVRIPVAALGNPNPVMLPPGQPLLIQTAWAMPFSGDDLALVPATALEGWRGIAPHVPAETEAILQLRLDQSAVLFIGPGLQAGCDGCENVAFDMKRFLQMPRRPTLPLAAARHMVAQLVADETCEAFKSLQAADLRPPPNLS
jgi:hypothetical protein